MHGVVVVRPHPPLLPLLAVAEITDQSGVEVADTPSRVAEGVAIDPLPVGGVVGHKDRALRQGIAILTL